MQIKKFSVVAAMALCVAALPALSISQANAQDRMTAVNAPLALGGYCPVCIVKMQKWEKGDPAISSLYDGKTYLFPSAAVKAKFDAAPASFVPALGGDCIVCYEKMGKRVAGSLKHTSLFKGRLYLFPSEKELNLFLANPAPFVDTDLAINGECVVCLAKMGKHIAGSTQYTVIHNGLRYLFPSAKEADMFRQSPAQFVQTTTSMGKTGKVAPAAKRVGQAQQQLVRFVGQSGCAGCEHGVRTIGSPDELGLALEMRDGSLVVVEDAHSLYPQLYKSRFDGDAFLVEGRVIKTLGNVRWIQPTKLQRSDAAAESLTTVQLVR